MSLNRVILIGNVGQDPEIKYFESGEAVAQFSLATNKTYNNKQGEKVTKVEWHKIVIYRKLAEVVEKYVKKGSQLYLEGEIRTRSYDGKDGLVKYITEVVVNQMQMLGTKSSDSGAMPPESKPDNKPQDNKPSQESNVSDEPDENDDLPF